MCKILCVVILYINKLLLFISEAIHEEVWFKMSLYGSLKFRGHMFSKKLFKTALKHSCIFSEFPGVLPLEYKKTWRKEFRRYTKTPDVTDND